jgi:hypothetical protein
VHAGVGTRGGRTLWRAVLTAKLRRLPRRLRVLHDLVDLHIHGRAGRRGAGCASARAAVGEGGPERVTRTFCSLLSAILAAVYAGAGR